MQSLTGADALVRTLADCGVSVCFANPGTSEMHLVAALDREPRIKPILCLFEGVATGAADAFARMAGKPAMTLLHLGPGFLNGGANIHNAKKAFAPSIAVIGEHATWHRGFDAPLSSDIEAITRPLAVWTRTVERAADTGALGAEAYARSMSKPSGCAALIMTADAAWNEGGVIAKPLPIAKPQPASAKAIEDAARAIKGAKKAVLVVGGDGLVEPGVSAAGRIEAAGVKAYHDMFVARLDRGAGLCALERLAYFSEMAREQLAGADLMVVVGQKAPVSFFAYPNRPRSPIPDGCAVIELGDQSIDAAETLRLLADALGAPAKGSVRASQQLDLPAGPLSAFGIGAALSRRMPEGAVVADDGITSGMPIFTATAGAARHSWLGGTGGAIGSGMPNAIGAAVGAPDAKVVCVTGDGSAMYTCQSLWTMARERLNVTTIVCNNRAYRILDVEMMRTGANQAGPAARALFDLDNPRIDFVKLAESQGVRGARCDTAEALDAELARCFSEPGPHLIEAVI